MGRVTIGDKEVDGTRARIVAWSHDPRWHEFTAMVSGEEIQVTFRGCNLGLAEPHLIAFAMGLGHDGRVVVTAFNELVFWPRRGPDANTIPSQFFSAWKSEFRTRAFLPGELRSPASTVVVADPLP
jgi:hypothetical protein